MDNIQKDTAFRIKGRLRSFKYAFAGIVTLVTSQHNAWIHTAATVAVIGAGFFFGVTASEWCWLILAMVAVWSTEALNTAFEFLADVASPDFHPLVKQAKDVAASAVLIAAIGATAIGAIIFIPYM